MIQKQVKFVGSCLKQPKISYTWKSSKHLHCDPILKNCLFGAVTLTKNADIDKYRYSDYGLHLIENQIFHFQVVDLVKMY